jgi:hypothetical protein
MSVALSAIVIFSIRAWLGYSPWADVLYGVLAEMLLLWALRPNLKKLFAGEERIVRQSLHGWIRSRREGNQPEHGNAT